MVFAIGDVIETLHKLLLIELKRDSKPFEPIPIDNIFLLDFMTFIPIENSLTDLFGIFFVVVLLELSNKLEKLFFGKSFFLVVELFHKG